MGGVVRLLPGLCVVSTVVCGLVFGSCGVLWCAVSCVHSTDLLSAVRCCAAG